MRGVWCVGSRCEGETSSTVSLDIRVTSLAWNTVFLDAYMVFWITDVGRCTSRTTSRTRTGRSVVPTHRPMRPALSWKGKEEPCAVADVYMYAFHFCRLLYTTRRGQRQPNTPQCTVLYHSSLPRLSVPPQASRETDDRPSWSARCTTFAAANNAASCQIRPTN